MSDVPFTRPTLIAAVTFLNGRLNQAAFNHMVLRIGLENDIPSDTGLSVAKKADLLGRIIVHSYCEGSAVLFLFGVVVLYELELRLTLPTRAGPRRGKREGSPLRARHLGAGEARCLGGGRARRPDLRNFGCLLTCLEARSEAFTP
jgi:hypothetical protein